MDADISRSLVLIIHEENILLLRISDNEI